jgi:hypothetical protein
MRTSIAFTVAALAALSPLVTSADESSSFWESISDNRNYAEPNTVETPRMIQIEKKYGLAEPYEAKNPKTHLLQVAAIFFGTIKFWSGSAGDRGTPDSKM